jgi:hypothetical protein
MTQELSYEHPAPDGFVPVVDEHIVPVEEDESGESISGSPKRAYKKKRDGSQLRKAPQAPKRFKSSYICFFMAKQPDIKEELGAKATVTEISKRSAEMWYVVSVDRPFTVRPKLSNIFSFFQYQAKPPRRKSTTLGRRCSERQGTISA